MNYEKELLERLIRTYERSNAFGTGKFSKRVALTVVKEAWIQERMENPDEKKLFLSTLEELKRSGLIDYEWKKFEEGNLVEKIWLIPKEQAIRSCYGRLGCTPTKEKAGRLLVLIEEYQRKLEPETSVSHFLREYMEKLRKKQKIQSFFTEDTCLNEDILKCLVYMEKNQEEQMERVMSAGLYGDSKRFEKQVKPKVLSILRHLKKEEDEDVPEDEELPREKGIVRWPEILEFTGNLTVCLKDGSMIDYGTQKYGAYINSDTVKETCQITPKGIRRVLFIENKANYIWYIANKRRDDELIVFHGGCYSPIKGRWFQALYTGCQKRQGEIRYFHWSDIDAGGFRIFCRLRKNIIPELEPYWMDADTLKKYEDKAMKIQSESYLRILAELEQDSEFACFHEVISSMLNYRIRLEQEQIIF